MRKVVKNKLQVTRRKVSKEWSKYRTVKKKVLSRKRLSTEEKKQILLSEREQVRSAISGKWVQYQDVKYGLTHKAPFPGFSFTKKQTGVYRIDPKTGKRKFYKFSGDDFHKIYKARSGYDTNELDSVIPKILNERGVKGVLVVFQVESEETGQKQYVSNYITKTLFKRIEQSGESVFEYVASRLRAGNTKDYKLKFIYLRVVYEKSKM